MDKLENLDIKHLKMLSQGNTAEIFDIDSERVLKLYRKGLPTSLAQQEFEKTLLISEVIDNSPKVYQIGKIGGRDGIIMEKISGPNMIEVILKHIFSIKKFSKKLADIQAAFQKPTDKDLPSVKDGLKSNINECSLLESAEKQKLCEYIDSLPSGNSLCHFDFHPGNIIMKENSPVVIDWMTAHKGDPLSDAARTSLLLKYGIMMTANPIVKEIVHIFQNKIYKYYIKEYLRLTGAEIRDIEKWILPVAAARLVEWLDDKEKTFLLSLVREKLKAF